jgi:hypothetical protein
MLDQLRELSGIRSPAEIGPREYHIRLPSARPPAGAHCPRCHVLIERPVIDVPRSSCRSTSVKNALRPGPVGSEPAIEGPSEGLPSPRRESAPEPARGSRAEINFKTQKW